MPTKQMPMIAPDGTPGMVDAESAQDAVNQGYHPGLHVTAPNGDRGIVKFADLKEAMAQGYKPALADNASTPYQASDPQVGLVDTPMRFLKGLGENLVGQAKGLYNQVTAPAEGNAEKFAAHVGALQGYRALIRPQINQAQQAMDAYRSGGINDPSTVGHALAAVTPIAGPLAASIAESVTPKIARGDYAGAAGDVGGTALTAYLMGRAGKAMMPESVVPKQNYAPSHASAFEGLTANATGMGKNFIPQNLTPEALSPIRETTARMAQGTPTEQGIASVVTGRATPPLDRVAAFQNVLDRSMSDLEAQHAPVLAQAAHLPADTSSLIQQLKAKITPTMDPSDVNAINTLIDRTQAAKTVGDLGKFRQELNTESSPQYRQSAMQAGRSGVSVQATGDLADAVRGSYYDHLKNATGQDMSPIKRQESNLMTVQEALQNQQSPLAVAEAKFAAPSTMREKIGSIANILKDPKATVTQTLLRESPAMRSSVLIRKSLQDLPEVSRFLQAPDIGGTGVLQAIRRLAAGGGS